MKWSYNGVQKWTLTGCLVAALGFSVSHNAHEAGFASLELASEQSVEGKIATADGVAPVKYIPYGDGKIAAIVRRTTEGEICTANTCHPGIVTINESFEKNKGDIAQLNSLLLKAIKEEANVENIAKKPVARTDTERKFKKEASTETDKVEEALEKIVADCKSEKEETHEILECKADNFAKYLDSLKGKPSSKVSNLLNTFYRTEIEQSIGTEIKDAKKILAKLRRGEALTDEEEGKAAQIADIQKSAHNAISSILEKTPKNFESLRKRMIAAEALLLGDEAMSLRGELREARNQGPQQLAQAQLERNRMMQMIETLRASTANSLKLARDVGNINSTQADKYYRDFNTYATELRNSIAQSAFDFTIPSTSLTEGLDSFGSLDDSRSESILARKPLRSLEDSPLQSALKPSLSQGVVFAPVREATSSEIKFRDDLRSKR